MTNPPPVAPVEGHLYLLFTEYENTTNIRKWSKEPFYGAQEYVLKLDYADLIAACDEALNWADANARWFDISTAPDEIGVEFLASIEIQNSNSVWKETHVLCLDEDGIDSDHHRGWDLEDYTDWRPLPPPPSNPPLPEPLERLGEVLRRIKGVG